MTTQARPLSFVQRTLAFVIVPLLLVHYLALRLWETTLPKFTCDTDSCAPRIESFWDMFGFYADTSVDFTDAFNYHALAFAMLFCLMMALLTLSTMAYGVATGKFLPAAWIDRRIAMMLARQAAEANAEVVAPKRDN